MIFSNRTVHMSTKNTTNKLRISCDTRWQRKDEPVDPRFVGTFPKEAASTLHGMWADTSQVNVRTMEDMKTVWGL